MVGGGIISRRPACVSGDGRLVLAPCGRTVHVYGSATGERVGTLAGHTAEVTCVLLNPENDTQVYTTSLDGTVRLWDASTHTCLRTIEVKEAVKAIVIQKDLGVAYLSIQLRENGGGRVLNYNLTAGKYSGTAMKTRAAGPLALSPTGSLCATIDRHSLFVWRTGTDIYQPLNLQHTKPYTCLAINSNDTIIAAGDASGRILIWRDFEQHVPAVRREGAHSGKHHPTSPPPLTTVHWHSAPVASVCFSSDSVYLLSGGSEGVLVLWQLETNRPNFLPRLGGPLIGIHTSPADPARYLVRQADNCLRLINTATMKVEASVHGLRPLPPGVEPGAAGAATALRSGALVVPTDNAQLQLYDPLRDRHVSIVRVAPRNAVSTTPAVPYVSGGGAAAAAAAVAAAVPAAPVVQYIAFSADGSVMATVDLRPDAGAFGATEACLKFWDASSGSSASGASTSGRGANGSSSSGLDPFLLNTRVDEPHRGGVTSLAYHPSRHMAVTTGLGDREFKIWVLERAPRRPGQAAAGGPGRTRGPAPPPAAQWRCQSLASYKGLPLTAAAFSSEGSVLAIGAGSKVTLWDPETLALAAVMAPPAGVHVAAAGAVTRLAFVSGTPYLVAASASSLTVYNLLTAAVHWSHAALQVLSLSADPLYPRFAVAVPALPASAAAGHQPAGPSNQHEQQHANGAAGNSSQQPQVQPLSPSAPSGGAGAAATASGSTGQQQQQQQRAAIPGREQLGPKASCTVLVFDPSDPVPRQYCHVANAQHVHVMHMAPEALLGGSAAAPEAAESSPLLLLKDNRQYVFSLPPGLARVAADTQEAPQQPAAAGGDVSAFEAAFGSLELAGQQQQHQAADAMEVDGAVPAARDSKGPKWQALFDLPSHALPPPTALAQAFLTLLTTTEQ